jgi:sulfur relay (sulfurtransferase) DsrC/TusE family protein
MATTGSQKKRTRSTFLPGPLGRTRIEIEEAAREEGIWPVTLDHWRVIQFIRAFYRDSGDTPPAVRIGRAANLSPRRLQELFPHGAVKTVFRLTGLGRELDRFEPCPFLWMLGSPAGDEN